jgi:hypothetical protein
MQSNRLLFGVGHHLCYCCNRWGHIWSRTVRGTTEHNGSGQPELAQPSCPDEPLTIALYYPEGKGMGSVAVKRQPDGRTARVILAAMLGDQRVAQTALLKDMRLRELYLDASGTAYIDLASVQQKEIRVSARDELVALYAVVNTILQNIEEIKSVRVLLDGREAQTLAGHIDLSRAFSKRMDLVKQ